MIREKIDNYLEKALVNYDLPGLCVGIEIGQKSENFNKGLTYQKALGYKNLEKKEILKTENVFHMASVTKLFVGTAIMMLCESGKLKLEGLLSDYLPWFEMKDERYKRITIRELLSHTSGMPDVLEYNWDKPEFDEEALKRYVKSEEVRNSFLLWDPEDNKFSYSNIGYEILGTVIAEVSGLSFEEYVKTNIFEKLGMQDSKLLTFEWGIYEGKNKLAEIVCSPHEKDDSKNIIVSDIFPYNRAHGPSSTLTSTVEDLRKWGRAHLDKGIISKEGYDIMWEEQSLVPNNGEKICLSWFKREQNGFTLYGHEGTDDGFRASFWICPELDLSITVCSNISAAPVKKINKKIFELIIEK